MPKALSPPPAVADINDAIQRLEPYMIATLSSLVGAASFSGSEQSATLVMEEVLSGLGLTFDRISLNSKSLQGLPLYSPPCCPDGGRYNLLAVHDGVLADAKSVLFNGHLDVVPTGDEALWRTPPFVPSVEDGWLYGRGSGDMKAGIVCALVALKALQTLGLQPAGRVGFNWVLEEESTGNGTLASVFAIRQAVARSQLESFDAVLIPEPLGEQLTTAQVGVFWMCVELTGRPSHAAYMTSGSNPVDAAFAVMADLKILEAEWNREENKHPAFRDIAHPINFNLGRIEGGEWNSSVPCKCILGVRIGFYPDMSVPDAKEAVERRVREVVRRLGNGLKVSIRYEGFHAPGCEFELDSPAMGALAQAHRDVHGTDIGRGPTTATTDARHFRLMLDLPVTCYGPEARNIHGIDESVSISSMRRVAAVFASFIANWCGVVQRSAT